VGGLCMYRWVRYVFCVRVGTLGFFLLPIPLDLDSTRWEGGSAPQALIIVSGCNVLLERKIRKNMLQCKVGQNFWVVVQESISSLN